MRIILLVEFGYFYFLLMPVLNSDKNISLEFLRLLLYKETMNVTD